MNYRDSDSGLDYAQNRYYSSAIGRFLTPDPYKGNSSDSGDADTPQSWNHYAYVQGDPVNHTDRHGLFLDAEDCIGDPEACEAEDWPATIGYYSSSQRGGGSAPAKPFQSTINAADADIDQNTK